MVSIHTVGLNTPPLYFGNKEEAPVKKEQNVLVEEPKEPERITRVYHQYYSPNVLPQLMPETQYLKDLLADLPGVMQRHTVEENIYTEFEGRPATGYNVSFKMNGDSYSLFRGQTNPDEHGDYYKLYTLQTDKIQFRPPEKFNEALNELFKGKEELMKEAQTFLITGALKESSPLAKETELVSQVKELMAEQAKLQPGQVLIKAIDVENDDHNEYKYETQMRASAKRSRLMAGETDVRKPGNRAQKTISYVDYNKDEQSHRASYYEDLKEKAKAFEERHPNWGVNIQFAVAEVSNRILALPDMDNTAFLAKVLDVFDAIDPPAPEQDPPKINYVMMLNPPRE